ncbi:MAG: hypothetical protein M1406_04740 [Nitrospirae bacterium]|nr:hypothetical protein [Nitrospirota bacterium]
MVWKTKQVLVTVKAYPNPSKKYGETVCVAGIDLETRKWIRLYPIPYRDLEDDKKFKKYSVIEVRTHKAQDDTRPESYKVDSDSIKVIDRYDSKNGWEKRKPLVMPTSSPSLCAIQENNRQSGMSLGMFKPCNISFTYEKIKLQDQPKRKDCYSQKGFFTPDKKPIEEIPFDFRYQFRCCGEKNCKGHDLLIIDWEINQSFRKWRYKYKDEAVLLDKIKERWLDEICSAQKDTYFFVGNVNRFRDIFMVLGAFYPPKK